MRDGRNDRWGTFVHRYEYLLIYISIVTTITLIVALLDG